MTHFRSWFSFHEKNPRHVCLVCVLSERPKATDKRERSGGVCSDVIIDEPFWDPIVFTKIERRHRAASSCRISLPPLLFWRNFQKGRRMNKREERHFFIWFSFSHQSTSSVKKEARYNSSYPVKHFFFYFLLAFMIFPFGKWREEDWENKKTTELRADDESCATTRQGAQQKDRGAGPFADCVEPQRGERTRLCFLSKRKKKIIFLSNDFFAFYIRRLSSLLLIQLNPSFHIPSESSSD